jgi:hypothetical protein
MKRFPAERKKNFFHLWSKFTFVLFYVLILFLLFRRKLHGTVVIHDSKDSVPESRGKLNKEDSSSTGSETDTAEQEDRGKEFLKAYFSSDSSDNSALTASLLAQVSADDPSVAASLGLLYDYYVQESAQSPTSPTSERYLII